MLNVRLSPWPVKSWLRTSLGFPLLHWALAREMALACGINSLFQRAAYFTGQLLNWLLASKAIVECRDVTPMVRLWPRASTTSVASSASHSRFLRIAFWL